MPLINARSPLAAQGKSLSPRFGSYAATSGRPTIVFTQRGGRVEKLAQVPAMTGAARENKRFVIMLAKTKPGSQTCAMLHDDGRTARRRDVRRVDHVGVIGRWKDGR